MFASSVDYMYTHAPHVRLKSAGRETRNPVTKCQTCQLCYMEFHAVLGDNQNKAAILCPPWHARLMFSDFCYSYKLLF